MAKHALKTKPTTLPKCPTGIEGLDDIMDGGLPRGRPTLVCGAAGCGKTLLALEFLVRGITEYDEPGALMSFEETAEELTVNVASLGFDVAGMIAAGRMAVDYVRVERSEIEETGEYDLEGLFVRLDIMIKAVKARRVVLDSVESLFAGLPNEAILRAELRRLFRWLKTRGVTCIITGEQGDNTLTRHGLEEYISDCVIFLDNRVVNQVATRRLRIVKYRGSRHGTNEYPILIGDSGISVLPISSLGLAYPVTSERITTGIPRLDGMLGGKGYYRGTSILISGTTGTGKTSLAVAFADAACRRGERCLYVSMEESQDQILRNTASIGFDLQPWIRKGLLRFGCVRPTYQGLESHLASIHALVKDFAPACVILDPVSNMTSEGDPAQVKSMLTRLIDFLKNVGTTALLVSLVSGGADLEQSEVGISSLIDTWILVRMLEANGERNRLLYVLKSRGMAHSNQMREFVLSDTGINLVDVYVGPGTVLTGSARLNQEAMDRTRSETDRQSAERRQRDLAQEQTAIAAQIGALQARLSGVNEELAAARQTEKRRMNGAAENRRKLEAARMADGDGGQERRPGATE